MRFSADFAAWQFQGGTFSGDVVNAYAQSIR